MSEHRTGSSNLQTIRPFVITHASPVITTASRNNYAYESQEFTTTLAEDAKSNKSVMTTKSTREVFDLLAKLLPLGILLLIVALMVHFVTYVKEIEPLRSISEVVCMALAATVIPLSIVFIMKTMCDWRRGSNSFWYSNYDCSYDDTLYIQPSPLPVRHQTATTIATIAASCSEQHLQAAQQSQLQQQRKASRQEPTIQTISLNDEHTLKETWILTQPKRKNVSTKCTSTS